MFGVLFYCGGVNFSAGWRSNCGAHFHHSSGKRFTLFGFGKASEKMSKRVRDAAFQSLVRQEVAWFDIRSDGSIISQLAEDAAMLQAFAGEPIRTMSLSLSSVLVGLIISFVYMW